MMKSRICIVDHDLASHDYLRKCLEREGRQVLILDNSFQINSTCDSGVYGSIYKPFNLGEVCTAVSHLTR